MTGRPPITGMAPEARDPSWPRRCAGLLAFLGGGPRQWPALEAWADATGLPRYDLRQQLAWLEIADLAAATPTDPPVWHSLTPYGPHQET